MLPLHPSRPRRIFLWRVILSWILLCRCLPSVHGQDCMKETSTTTTDSHALDHSSNNNKSTNATRSLPDVLVLIATQSFTGEELVEDILVDALLDTGFSFQVHLVDVAGLDWTELSLQQKEPPFLRLAQQAKTLLVIASTYGDGDPPNHALEFAEWLAQPMDHREDDPIPYAVFGLGDSNYLHYCQFAKYIDFHLARRGGSRLLEIHLGDAQHDMAGEFQRWTTRVVRELRQLLPLPIRTVGENGHAPIFASTGTDWRKSAIGADTFLAELVNKQELLGQDDNNDDNTFSQQDRSVLHVSFQVTSQQLPPHIQPGDHLGIYPHNPDAIVEHALQWLELEAHIQTTLLESVTNKDDDANNNKWKEQWISAWEFLQRHVDLAGKATPSTLRALLPFVGTLQLRALARDLTFVNTTDSSSNNNNNNNSDAAATAFEEWVGNRRMTKLDLVTVFDCRPSLQALARALGPIQPRLYSIATVHQYYEEINDSGLPSTTNRTTIGICMAVVAEGGLCTNYIANLPTNSNVRIYVNPSKFHFSLHHHHDQQNNHDTSRSPPPTILVAAGSGIGPYIGFLEHELETSNKHALPHIQLLVGARTPSEVLYKEQLQTFQENSGINVQYAFSRVPGNSKRHVQDLLKPSRQLWNDFRYHNATIYACGRLEICTSVSNKLLGMAQSWGHLSPVDAQQFVESLFQEGRFKTDCWSVAETPRMNHIAHPSFVPHNKIPRLQHHHKEESCVSNTGEYPEDSHHSSNDNVDLSSVPAWPSYLRLLASGEFDRRLEEAERMFSACVACGRFCEVDRLSPDPADWGECRIGRQAIVSAVDAHFGEEPCLKGVNGSGTIFFGACNLKCMYCQNWRLSVMDQGEVVSDQRLASYMLELQERGCHNINFVSPTHNILPMMRGIYLAAQQGLRLPIVFNSGGYDSVASLRLLEGIIDIYMPDAKYASRKVARKLSKIDNYPEINQAAIREMHRQVGDLQIDPRTGLAFRGMLVRHLVLPNDYGGTADVAQFLMQEVSDHTYTHVMKYYRPEHKAADDTKFGMNRKPSTDELQEAHRRARFAGLHRILY